MTKQFAEYAEKMHAMSVRERLLIIVTIVALLIFIWWNFYAEPRLAKTDQFAIQNAALRQENNTLTVTVDEMNRRINQGVNQTKQQQLQLLSNELKTVNDILRQMTLELIEPDEMFELMQQLIFAESNLKLTTLKRKQVMPAFSIEEGSDEQPEIYRHVMQMQFEGAYLDILNYISRLEQTEWKLIWDSISLKTTEYPVVQVDIEISTLSGHEHWVGL